ncbi:DUF4231 domain-containing protein [Flavobacterium sp. 120]|uniref:DUF4231 domain-containing protein n=1 Tax=Flavobacterium sp. 120 TaxID=2135626 RepID=UPI000EADAA74|nr:DUF4231 domain-containing protein [Flavobacterium sp. 120]RKS14949.1 uncharacterized protein DUF4231 [Flavobacterium sp. 120]
MSESLEYAEKTLKGFKEKANHNKNESLVSFVIILTSSLLAPLFITLGEGIILSKIIPSILSVIAAGFTSWLQLRKPQKLWSLYRECQRLIEDQVIKYKFKVGEYSENVSADSLLAEKVAEIALNAHYQWTSVVPNPETLNSKEKI